MTKEIKTNEFEGLAILDKEGKLTIGELYDIALKEYKYEHCEYLGTAEGITEDVCEKIVDYSFMHEDKGYKNYMATDSHIFKFPFSTAIDSFNSLMESLGCYSRNPFPDPELTMKQGNGSVYYGATDEEFEQYTKAEEQTGYWLIVKKL